jgi:hypothetical protein
MVLFRMAVVRQFGEAVIRRMFHLPPDIALAGVEYVVLTSAGRFVAKADELVCAEEQPAIELPAQSVTLAQRYARQLAAVECDNADCIGLGEKPPFAPVLLHVRFDNEVGQATALFHAEPSREHYELLPSVGVSYQGGELRDGFFVATFLHRLGTHVAAGELADFSRTGNCNEFFLRHGDIDQDLEIGLIRASGDRIGAAALRANSGARRLADRACRETLAMSCEPPPPEEPYPYGDLVPLGFLLRSLGGEHAGLRQKLLDSSKDRLWAFETGRLTTATDSALVLEGLDAPASVEALSRYADGHGAYYPQLAGPERDATHMAATPETAHWCQPDFATTCLIRALRNRARLSEQTPLEYIEAHFDARAGLFFANPYLTDWCVAQALRGDRAAEELRQRLASEILASANPDGSFGRFDVAVSTSFAILALASCGYRGRRLRVAQLRLLEFEEAGGFWPDSRPFYSSLLLTELQARAGLAPDGREIKPGIVASNSQLYELTFYRDTHRIIGTAGAALALAEASFPRTKEPQHLAPKNMARYKCSTHASYAGRFALRPYAGKPTRLVAQ